MAKATGVGPYSGRLAYDSDTDFHVDPEGVPVVTEDGGRTWRYATDGDASHYDRYHEQFVGVDPTANKLGELQLEHGRERAEALMAEEEPHHYETQPDDPHFAGVRLLHDSTAPVQTGHTEAWTNE